MGRDEMRASDADRQDVADRLRHALGEGRLELHEYDERLQQAYAAKTYGELGALVADLPQTAVASGQSPVVVAEPGPTGAWLLSVWDPYLRVVPLTVGIWLVFCLAAQEWVYPWPVWVGGPWGLVLIVSSIAGVGRGEPARWAVREERQRQAKLAKKERKRALKAAGGGPAAIDREVL